MSVVYVARDVSGRIKEVAAVPQPGRAEERLPADHAEVLAFETRPVKTDAERVRERAASDPLARAMVNREARRLGLTRQQVIDDLAANAG